MRIRSAEAPNLKSVLRKIIRDATTKVSEEDVAEVSVGADVRHLRLLIAGRNLCADSRIIGSKISRLRLGGFARLLKGPGIPMRQRSVPGQRGFRWQPTFRVDGIVSVCGMAISPLQRGSFLTNILTSSWRDRIQFTVLFGIATSVELFQARLFKSTAQHLYGGQFDVVQANLVLENVFQDAIASSDVV